jgi:hypothetical protein
MAVKAFASGFLDVKQMKTQLLATHVTTHVIPMRRLMAVFAQQKPAVTVLTIPALTLVPLLLSAQHVITVRENCVHWEPLLILPRHAGAFGTEHNVLKKTRALLTHVTQLTCALAITLDAIS